MISVSSPLRRTLPFLLLAFVMVLSACSLAEDITPPPGAQVPTLAQAQPTTVSGPVYPLVAPAPAKGQAIYVDKCAPCHGDKGLGDGPDAARLSGPVAAIGDPALARKNTPAQWFTVVTQGNLQNFMPPFTSLSEQQRWDVIAYVYTLSETDQAAAQGKDLYQGQCVRCHGEAGLGDGPDAAKSSTPLVKFTSQAEMADKTDTFLFDSITNGISPDMPAFASQFNDDQRWALVAYVRRLSYTSTAQASAQASASTPVSQTPAPGETPQVGAAITSTQTISSTAKGTVIVSVTNGSGGGLPANLPVTLYAFDNMQLAITRTLPISGSGPVTFKDVEAPSGRAFLAGVNYQNTTYGSDVGTIKDPTVPITLPITVYDTTTDLSGLMVDRMHVFFDFPTPGSIQIAELFIVSNPSNKAVIASREGEAVLSFDLPTGATNLQFQDGALGQRYLQTPTGFADTFPIRPGSGNYQVLFTYDLPYTNKLNLTLPVSLPVTAVVVLMPDNGVKIKSSQLQSGTSRDVSGATYIQYTGANLTPGSSIAMQISGKPSGATSILTASDTRNGLLIGLGALGIALIVVGVWIFQRNRSPHGDLEEEDEIDETSEAEEEAVEEDPETIMDKIIALDDLYQAREIAEGPYLTRRAELKGRLQKVSK